jgi:thymidylate kinase
MKKNLVLIEGIPGSGKSTFARFLSNQFERNGFTCRLYLETTYDHPIIESTGYDDYSLFLGAYYDRWSKFLDKFPNDEIVVMESAFFQSPIVHLLHKDVDRELIKSLINKVSNLLSKEDCKLIYFYQQDAPTNINKMIETRGGRDYLIRKNNEYKNESYFLNRQEQGPESHISFFLEYSVLANQIVQGVSIPVEIIENSSADYWLYQKQVLEKLNLKHFPDPVLETSLQKKYSGLYHNKDMDLRISVELMDDHLWIFGNKRMNPKGNDQFYLDDMSVLVSFITDNTNVTGLVITEKDLYANRNDNGTAFERVS